MRQVLAAVACLLAVGRASAFAGDTGTALATRVAHTEWLGQSMVIGYTAGEGGAPCAESAAIRHWPEPQPPLRTAEGEVATLELSIDEPAHVVAVYREHPPGQLATGAVIFDVDAEVTVTVEPGVYDIAVDWVHGPDNDPLVIREGVSLPVGTTQMSISVSEAVHFFQIRPLDEIGIELERSLAAIVILRRNGLLVHRADGLREPNNGLLFSPLGDAYSLEASTVTTPLEAPHSSPLYIHHGSFHGGISQDIIFANEPEDLRRVVLAQHVDAAVQEVLVRPCMVSRPWGLDSDLQDEMWFDYGVQCRDLSRPGLSPPAVHTVYTMPLPCPEFSTGYFHFEVYEHLDPDEPYDASHYLYNTPVLGWLDGIKGYYGGRETTVVFEPQEEVVDCGLGPWFWFGRFANSETEVRFGSAIGYHLWPFVGQTGAVRRGLGDEFPYRLLREGMVVAEGEFSIAYPWREHVFVVEPGHHILEIDFVAPVGPGQTRVVASMNTTAPDPDPPYITHLSLTHRGSRVQEIICPDGMLSLRAFDDDSGITSVSATYLAEDGPRPLTVEGGTDGEYWVAFPRRLVPVDPTELTLVAADASGNAIDMTMVVPAHNRHIPRLPSGRLGR